MRYMTERITEDVGVKALGSGTGNSGRDDHKGQIGREGRIVFNRIDVRDPTKEFLNDE